MLFQGYRRTEDKMKRVDKDVEGSPGAVVARSRVFGITIVLTLALFAVVAGVAGATTTRVSGGGGSSAAQDQYGQSQVLTPPTVKPATTPKVYAAKHVTTGKKSTPTTTTSSPATTTSTPTTTSTTKTPSSSGAALPFTGLSVFKVMLVGIALIALGFFLRRRQGSSTGDGR
jgi:hypothetical protein